MDIMKTKCVFLSTERTDGVWHRCVPWRHQLQAALTDGLCGQPEPELYPMVQHLCQTHEQRGDSRRPASMFDPCPHALSHSKCCLVISGACLQPTSLGSCIMIYTYTSQLLKWIMVNRYKNYFFTSTIVFPFVTTFEANHHQPLKNSLLYNLYLPMA